MTFTQNLALGVSGITALGIGALIMTVPQAFYASYGIALDPNPDLLSELRAPGAGLAAFGAVMLSGIVKSSLRQIAFVAALTVFLAFPAGRVVGAVIDGMPSSGIIGALALELAIAMLCLLAFRRGTDSSATDVDAR